MDGPELPGLLHHHRPTGNVRCGRGASLPKEVSPPEGGEVPTRPAEVRITGKVDGGRCASGKIKRLISPHRGEICALYFRPLFCMLSGSMSYRRTYRLAKLTASEVSSLAKYSVADASNHSLACVASVRESLRSNAEGVETFIVPSELARLDVNCAENLLRVHPLAYAMGIASAELNPSNSAEICPFGDGSVMCRFWDEEEASELEDYLKTLLAHGGCAAKLRISEGG